MAYDSRDIYTDPSAKAELEALSLGTVPVAVLGERRLSIMHTDQLRVFLGLPAPDGAAPYQEFVAALERVLEAVERAVRQVPADQIRTPTPNRGRDLPELVFNIHDPIAIMGRSLDSGRFDWRTASDFDRSRHFANTNELAGFCHEVRLPWFERASLVDPETAEQTVETPKGVLTNQQVLAAQSFHAAQHLRQIYVFLREIGIEPVQELLAKDIAPIELGEIVF